MCRKYYASHERDPTTVVSQPVQVSKMADRRKKGELRKVSLISL